MASFFENLRQATHEITTGIVILPEMLETAMVTANSTMNNTSGNQNREDLDQALSDLEKYTKDNHKIDSKELTSILRRIRNASSQS